MKEIDREFMKVTDEIESVNYNIDKLEIFDYDTLDEVDPKVERLRSDVTVEIGGPTAHLKFTVRTRQEHTIIKNAVTSILETRHALADEKLTSLCKERIND